MQNPKSLRDLLSEHAQADQAETDQGERRGSGTAVFAWM